MTAASEAVLSVVAAAGGRLVGKTRLQKTVYVLELAGVGFDFPFSYHYYGPYSEDLACAVLDAQVDGLIEENEETAQWGGRYSIFEAKGDPKILDERRSAREALVKIAKSADPVELEIAATAAFLKSEGVPDFWRETARRKPQKARPEVIEAAKELWNKFRQVPVPNPLPEI